MPWSLARCSRLLDLTEVLKPRPSRRAKAFQIGYALAVGKFFALVIIVFMAAWLAPMCARLTDERSAVVAPVPAVEAIAPPVSTEPAAAPEPAPTVTAPKPAASRPSLTLATYFSRKMFPVENDKYVVSVLRANKAGVPAVGVTMTLSTRINGSIVEHAESGPGQTLLAGSSSYFGLRVSTVVFEELLDSPAEPGNELDWSVSYRFQDDAPDVKRCFRLRALPRRLEQGLSWLTLGESRKCGAPAK